MIAAPAVRGVRTDIYHGAMIDMPSLAIDDVVMRPLEAGDARALCRAYVRNRDHLRPWEPRRSDGFFTEQGQAERVSGQLEEREAGRFVAWVLADGDEVVGWTALSNVSLGPFRSANLGYWVDAGRAGRGLATAVVREACRAADELLGLHRVEAGTLVDNVASQRVLAKCGFTRIGTAPEFLHIDGEWRDHVIFQKILNDRAPQ